MPAAAESTDLGFTTMAIGPRWQPRLEGASVEMRGCCACSKELCGVDGGRASEPVMEMAGRTKFLAHAATKGFQERQCTAAWRRKLEEHGAFLGAGAAEERLKGFPQDRGLGPGSIDLYGEFGPGCHWRDSSLAEYGHILLAGTLDNFKMWAKSRPYREEVVGVTDGRLSVYIEHGEGDADPGRGYITFLVAGGATASPTVCHGVGYALWQNGDWYHGSFRDGKQHGRGTYGCSNGGSYDGEWAEGNHHGRGTYCCPDGGSYDGEFAKGKKHGRGKYSYPRGGSYDGEFAEGNRHGQGTYSFPDGAAYHGAWAGDSRHGQGTFSFPGGGAYDGDWAGDVRHGRGTRCFASGDQEQCVYEHGELQSSARPRRRVERSKEQGSNRPAQGSNEQGSNRPRDHAVCV